MQLIFVNNCTKKQLVGDTTEFMCGSAFGEVAGFVCGTVAEEIYIRSCGYDDSRCQEDGNQRVLRKIKYAPDRIEPILISESFVCSTNSLEEYWEKADAKLDEICKGCLSNNKKTGYNDICAPCNMSVSSMELNFKYYPLKQKYGCN